MVIEFPGTKQKSIEKQRNGWKKEAEKFFKGFCEIVKKEPLLDLFRAWGCWIFFYGEQLARISLDPFEISAMNVALGRNKLKEYILATNGYDEYAYQQLLKEYKNKARK